MNFKKFVRDYLEYYPSEKKGVFYLALLISLWGIGVFVYSRIPAEYTSDREFEAAVADYYRNLEQQEKKPIDITAIDEEIEIQRFYFNPNSVSFDSLLLLGLPGRTAHSIINYRNSGGRFSEPKDLAKIYTLTSEDFHALEPFIRIPRNIVSRDIHPTDQERADAGTDTQYARQPVSADKMIVVDINVADTNQLMQIRGIGSYFAQKIVEHRKKLGGYHSLEQLLEIYYFDREKLDQLAPHFVLNSDAIQTINLNTVSLDELRRHPYFTYSIANSIVQMREMHGPYKRIEEVHRSYLMNDSIFNRIKPYISVHD